MTREDILRMAQEADVWVAGQDVYQVQLERFAGLVAAAESQAWVRMINSIDLAGLRDYPNMQRLVAELLKGIVDCMSARKRLDEIDQQSATALREEREPE
jgi:hypothetical protein